MYKRETKEYDTEHIQKYGEDLNATLLFVSFSLSKHDITLTMFTRLVCSLPSAPRLSSTYSRSSNQTLSNVLLSSS